MPFCCTGACGVVATGTSAVQRHWNTVANTPTQETTTVPPDCTAGYKFIAAADAHYLAITVADRTLSGGFWWRYTGTVTGTVTPMTAVNASGNGAVQMTAAGVLQGKSGSGTLVTGPTLTADTWYWITWKYNSSGATATITLRAYDTTGTQVGSEMAASDTQTAADVTSLRFGATTTVSTLTCFIGGIYVDDIDTTYPHALKQVVAMFPTGDGTHSVGSGTFQTNTGAAITGATTTAWQSLPTTDIVGSTPHVRQTANDGAAYLEFTFSGAPAGTADCVTVTANMLSQGTGANTSKYTINDNGTIADVVPATDFSQTTDSYVSKSYATAPASGAWTQSVLNAIRFRWGYLLLAPDNAVLGGLLLEVAGAPAVAGFSPTDDYGEMGFFGL